MTKNILMVAEAAKARVPRLKPSRFKTKFLSAEEFYSDEKTIKQHDNIIWKNFKSRGKYLKRIKQASFYALIQDKRGRYIASLMVIQAGDVWVIEYVMTDPAKQSRGAGSAMMSRLMRESKKHGAVWVALYCDPKKNDGQLPKFYGKFGFKEVVT